LLGRGLRSKQEDASQSIEEKNLKGFSLYVAVQLLCGMSDGIQAGWFSNAGINVLSAVEPVGALPPARFPSLL
jgi:hypothetical protein